MEALRMRRGRALNPLSRKKLQEPYKAETMADRAQVQSGDPGSDRRLDSAEGSRTARPITPEAQGFSDPGLPPSPGLSSPLPTGPVLGQLEPSVQANRDYSIEIAQQWLTERGLSQSPYSRRNCETPLPSEPQEDPVEAATLRSRPHHLTRASPACDLIDRNRENHEPLQSGNIRARNLGLFGSLLLITRALLRNQLVRLTSKQVSNSHEGLAATNNLEAYDLY